jgi:RND family efflux transporter MFP subunit
MRHLLLPLILVPLLLACKDERAAVEPVRAVRTLTLQAGNAALQHEYAAEVRARVESRLGFRVGGKLVQRHVDLGQRVKAGQLLAQLDGTDLQLGQDAARAALRAAQAQLALSEAEFRRYQALRDQGFISGLELERREAALKASRSQAEQALAQAGVQSNQAGYAALRADAPGVVTAVDAEPGTVLAAGTPVLRLAHDGPRDAVFSVPEDRVDAVRAMIGRPGALRLRPWGAGDAVLPATVREVAAAADPATRTFLVKADIGSADLALGRTATVLIDAPAQPGVVKLPMTAVFGQGGRSQVWLVDSATMTVRAQPIEVAGAEGNLVVVAGGLTPGQTVVTAGVHALNPGQKVRWYAEPGAAAETTAAATAAMPASR